MRSLKSNQPAWNDDSNETLVLHVVMWPLPPWRRALHPWGDMFHALSATSCRTFSTCQLPWASSPKGTDLPMEARRGTGGSLWRMHTSKMKIEHVWEGKRGLAQLPISKNCLRKGKYAILQDIFGFLGSHPSCFNRPLQLGSLEPLTGFLLGWFFSSCCSQPSIDAF